MTAPSLHQTAPAPPDRDVRAGSQVQLHPYKCLIVALATQEVKTKIGEKVNCCQYHLLAKVFYLTFVFPAL